MRRAALAVATGLAATLAAVAAGLGACASPSRPDVSARPGAPAAASAAQLAQALASRPIVLLGEVHDNAAQHALRLEALRQWIGAGARPAMAFEQLDADRQAALDQARAAFDPSMDRDARVARIVELAGAKGWNWDFYRPYLALALEYDLPVVAANLSRARAMRLAKDGAAAVFDAGQRAALGLDEVAPELRQAQEREIVAGHCGRVPPEAAPPMALAQIARDAVLAASIAPYAARGVVLLTGNGHARRDIGVVRHLAPQDRDRAVSIGLLENDEKARTLAASFDVAFLTPAQARADPCRMMGG
jgi:uncharacterized iron-regulated protein